MFLALHFLSYIDKCRSKIARLESDLLYCEVTFDIFFIRHPVLILDIASSLSQDIFDIPQDFLDYYWIEAPERECRDHDIDTAMLTIIFEILYITMDDFDMGMDDMTEDLDPIDVIFDRCK